MIVGLLILFHSISTMAAADGDSSWSDRFSGPGNVAASKHVEWVRGGGVTISGSEQVWSLPAQTPFSAGSFSGSVVITGEKPGNEALTLWREILNPGSDFEALPLGGDPGSLRIHAAGRDAFPFVAKGSVAGWGKAAGRLNCSGGGPRPAGGSKSRPQPAALARTREPVCLAPGATYAFSFLVSGWASGGGSPAVSFQLARSGSGEVIAEKVMKGADLAGYGSAGYEGMAKQTLVSEIPPSANDFKFDFRVLSHSAPGTCFMMGPVYVTAQDGLYEAPVFDSLSSLTAWRRIEYSFDESRSAYAEDCACPPGSPVSPVALRYGLSDSKDAKPDRSVESSQEEIGVSSLHEGAAGRYMAISIRLYGRARAGLVDAALAPADSTAFFAGLTPVVRYVKVRYFARAAEVVSPLIFPSSIRRWSKIEYDGLVPPGTRIVVDALSADGSVIAGGMPAEFVPGPEMDVFKHQAIRLRARLYDDPDDRKRRPVLRSWGVSWERDAGRLSLRPSVFNPGKGESVEGLVHNAGGGRTAIRIYGKEGRLVRKLAGGVFAGGSVAFSWDGLQDDGFAAAPGEYYVTSTSRDGAATRKVRVVK